MERKLGTNLKRLIAYKVSQDAVPAGGGVKDALAALTTPGRMAELSRNALAWVDQAVAAVRSAPDNPYGDDEEAICGAILEQLGIKK